MSKKVDIKEGGSAKPMSNVSRILTDVQSGGLMAWVPEDERLIRTKHISENGTYVAAQEALYGYSKLTINVAGGSDGETVPTLEPDGEMQPTPEAKATEPDEFEEEYGVLTEDPEGTKETIKAPTGGTNKDKSNGSTIVGKDPDTGETTVVTVDKTTGQITKQTAPKAIAITKMPDKMSYEQGEEMDYTGIEVMLYSKYEETVGPDGSVQVDAVPYRDAKYPDGKIPFSELIMTADPATSGTKDGVHWLMVPVKMWLRNRYCNNNTEVGPYGQYSFVGQSALLATTKPIYTENNSGKSLDAYLGFGNVINNYDWTYYGPRQVTPDPIDYSAIGKGYELYMVRQKYKGWDGTWNYMSYCALRNVDFPYTPSGGYQLTLFYDDYGDGPLPHGGGSESFSTGKFRNLSFGEFGRDTSQISEEELPYTDSSIAISNYTPADLLRGVGERRIIVSWKSPYTNEPLETSYKVEVETD